MRVASLIIIHQPSPKVFSLFDKLILLSNGRCLFSDYCSNLSTFYKTNYGEDIPYETNIAEDLLIKASRHDVCNAKTESVCFESDQCLETGLHECDLDENLSSEASLNDFSKETSNADLSDSTVESTSSSSGDVLFKFLMVFHRNLLNQYTRNITNAVVRLLSSTCLTIIIGIVFWRVGSTDSKAGLTFEEADLLLRVVLFLMFVSYLLPFSTIPIFYNDKRYFAAESALGLYPTWMHVMSQVSSSSCENIF